MSNQIQNPNVKWKIFIVIILLSLELYKAGLVFAVAGGFNINLQVESEAVAVCDNDGVCDSGETSANCPNDCPALAVVRGGEFPDTEPPTIYGIKVSDLTLTSVVISWETTEQARCALFLGETIDYEKLKVTESKLATEHLTNFTELLPETIYNFKISCKDNSGNIGETKNNIFSTLSPLPPADTTAPTNVSDFEAVAGDKKVDLKWKNPPDEDFKEVLIVRSTEFYPAEPWEGIPIYLGTELIVRDINVENEIIYYYTVFSYDQSGNYSSGAIASAVPQAPSVIPPVVPIPPKPPVKPPIAPPPPEVEKIGLNNFTFTQKGRIVALLDSNKLRLKEKELLTISIDYEKVPEVLKTIMVTLEKDNKYFSFLLRIDKEKTKYLATLVSPEPGIYPMTLYVLDYKNQALKAIEGVLEIERAEVSALPVEQRIAAWLKKIKWAFYGLLAILIIGLIIHFLSRKKQGKSQSIGYPT